MAPTSTGPMADAAGIVLAGGRSSRMGSPKAALEWHGSTLLRRVTGIVARAVDGPVVVVRAPGQELPPLPAAIAVVDDACEGQGPLQGLAAGLAAARAHAPVAYVSSTDVPLLHPQFVRRVLAALAQDLDADVALPHAGGFPQPLAAAYRTDVVDVIERRIAAGRMRLMTLFDEIRVRRLDTDELLADPALAAVDPALRSVMNVNEPADYAAARARPAPAVIVAVGDGPGRTVPAATLGAAAAAAGVRVDLVSLNGAPVAADPELPLVDGDAVGFGPV